MADIPDQLARSLAILAEPAVARWTTRKKLLRAVTLAAESIGSCDGAGLILLGAAGSEGEVCTNAVAYALDQAQYRADQGPCLQAVRSLQIFNLASIAASSPSWPEFRATAAANGIRSSLSVPLTIRGSAIGMLNLYSERVDGFDGCERAAATFAAGVAAAVSPDPAEHALARPS